MPASSLYGNRKKKMKSGDPDQPSYKHPQYVENYGMLKLLHDVYHDLKTCKEEYLPKAQVEDDNDYDRRLERSVFNNKVKAIINQNAALLNAFTLEDMPPLLELASKNIDRQGNDIQSFFFEANKVAERDGCCYILSHRDPIEEGRTRADDIENPNIPYWEMIERNSIINWRTRLVDGFVEIIQFTIERQQEIQDGRFGVGMETVYDHYFVNESNQVERIQFIEVDDQFIPKSAEVLDVPRMMLRVYYASDDPFPQDTPEFYKAAQLNIKLFRQESSLDSLQYRVNAPTYFRKLRVPLAQRAPLVVGENTVIELMAGDGQNDGEEVGVVEIKGESMASHETSIQRTLDQISSEGIGFLMGNTVTRTATEAFLSSSPVAGTLNNKASKMNTAIEGLLKDWSLLSGEDTSGVTFTRDQSVLEQPLDAQEMGQLRELWRDGGIDHQTLLELLKMGKQLPADVDVEEIVKRVKQEMAQKPQPDVQNGITEDPNAAR